MQRLAVRQDRRVRSRTAGCFAALIPLTAGPGWHSKRIRSGGEAGKSFRDLFGCGVSRRPTRSPVFWFNRMIAFEVSTARICAKQADPSRTAGMQYIHRRTIPSVMGDLNPDKQGVRSTSPMELSVVPLDRAPKRQQTINIFKRHRRPGDHILDLNAVTPIQLPWILLPYC
jgi:hypothetical protein